MKIEFDPIVDALYVELAEGEVEKTEEIKPGVMLDYDAAGNILGIEMLHVTTRSSLPLKQVA